MAASDLYKHSAIIVSAPYNLDHNLEVVISVMQYTSSKNSHSIGVLEFGQVLEYHEQTCKHALLGRGIKLIEIWILSKASQIFVSHIIIMIEAST